MSEPLETDARQKSARKFYRTVYTVEVLSETPITRLLDLNEINYMITYGDCSGSIQIQENGEIDSTIAAKLLIAQGSDPEFFRIDENGNDIED